MRPNRRTVRCNRLKMLDLGQTIRADISGPWLELNAGVSGQIDKHADLFANVSYQTKFNDNSYAIAGKVGVRMLW